MRRERDAARAEVERLKVRRLECASCHKAPTDDPGLALQRKNVKGVPGVFLCQFCDGAEAALARVLASLDEIAKAAITYQPAAKRIERIITIYKRAALEGRG